MKQKSNKVKFNEVYKEIMSDWDYNPHIEIVKVIWNDAHTNQETSSYRDISEDGLIKAETIGYLMDEKDDHIAVCGFLFPDERHDLLDPNNRTAFRNVHIIPKSQIKTVLILKTDYEESGKHRDSKRWMVKKL